MAIIHYNIFLYFILRFLISSWLCKCLRLFIIPFSVEPVSEQQRPAETSEDTLAAESVAEEDRKQAEKVEYKKRLFGQLSRGQVPHLYTNYKVDFEMFGYNAEEFLAYASSEWLNIFLW